ncbi:MAG: DUF6616 family protein [Gammaproteobacteria bacterium]
MQTVIILWEPNEKWHALSADEQRRYVLGLDQAVNAARAQGVMTLGWSEVDRSLAKAPPQGYVGVFALSSAADIHAFHELVQQAGWYEYFDSVNLSIAPAGGTNPRPSEEYARLLGMTL